MKPQTFEEFAAERGFDLSRDGRGCYVSHDTHAAHMVWIGAHENAALFLDACGCDSCKQSAAIIREQGRK